MIDSNEDPLLMTTRTTLILWEAVKLKNFKKNILTPYEAVVLAVEIFDGYTDLTLHSTYPGT